MRGAEKAMTCISVPAAADPIAHHTFRAKFVTALAKLRSFGATSDATYDCRVGTSISTRASLAKNSATPHCTDGANGTAIRNKLDGKWVNTMVFTSPMRRGSQTAAIVERDFLDRHGK